MGRPDATRRLRLAAERHRARSRASVVLGGTAWHVIDRASGEVRALPPSPTEVSVAYPLGLIAGRLVTVAEQSGEEFGAPRFVVFRPDDPTAFGG